MSTISSTPSVSVSITPDPDDWWIKNPVDPSVNKSIDVQTGVSVSFSERATEYQPLGRTNSVFVTDGITGETGQVTVSAISVAELAGLNALLRLTVPLLIQSPTGEQWYVRVSGDRQRKYENPDAQNPVYTVTFNITQVDKV